MLKYANSQLFIDDVAAIDIANQYGTPCFVYSKQDIRQNWQSFAEGFAHSQVPHKVYYAVKANSNLSILKLLVNLGSGFDCVSSGEIARVVRAGGKPTNIVFSGVGKSHAEIEHAISLGIHSINVESVAELERISAVASQLGKTAHIAIRVNPDIEANTHSYISTGKKSNKFGIDIDQAAPVFAKASALPNLHLAGITCHIGSQITTLQPFIDALDRVLEFVDSLPSPLEFINIGGGLGVIYKDEQPPTPLEYVTAILKKLGERKITLHMEPGRAIVANAGVLLTRIEYIKQNFAIVDAAMNDLIRPALYGSYHDIVPIQKRDTEPKQYTVVGPVCESGDFLGKDRLLTIEPNDLLAIKSCGAYCFCASSNYNSRPRAAEVMVDGNKTTLIRKRETIEQLWENEPCDA